MFHGKGELLLDDGGRYIGEFSEGLRKGSGKFSYSNGDIYEGSWDRNMRNGKGHLKYGTTCIYATSNPSVANGDSYDGEWLDDKKHGAGQFTYTTKKTIYRGEWHNDIVKCGEMSRILGDAYPELKLADPSTVLLEARRNSHAQTIMK